MKTKSAITPKERNLLLINLIPWFIGTAGLASFVIYLIVRILAATNGVNVDVWMYVSAFSLALIIVGINLIKLFFDFSSKEIDDGQSEITDVGRKLSSTFSRYIRLSSLGKEKILIQYADRDKLHIGDTIRFRIAPRSRLLLSFEVGVIMANEEVLFPAKEAVVEKPFVAFSQRLSIKQLISFSLVFGLVGLLLFTSWPGFVSFTCIFMGVYVAIIGEIPGIINGYKARLAGLAILVFGFFLFTEVAVPLLK